MKCKDNILHVQLCTSHMTFWQSNGIRRLLKIEWKLVAIEHVFVIRYLVFYLTVDDFTLQPYNTKKYRDSWRFSWILFSSNRAWLPKLYLFILLMLMCCAWNALNRNFCHRYSPSLLCTLFLHLWKRTLPIAMQLLKCFQVKIVSLFPRHATENHKRCLLPAWQEEKVVFLFTTLSTTHTAANTWSIERQNAFSKIKYVFTFLDIIFVFIFFIFIFCALVWGYVSPFDILWRPRSRGTQIKKGNMNDKGRHRKRMG